ncbi:UNVERIFIED_CONTAM: hypothetical protein GTU68_059534 [Idotea baltica]|nr:hypothetical protein [Idotea baltica]
MGKSETAKLFAELGVPVFDSDAAVHELLGSGGAAVASVEQGFPGVQQLDYIDRKQLGEIVFGDSSALERLENILHPMIASMRNSFLENAKSDLVLLDIPLLLEKGYEERCDYIVVVSAPEEIQKKRVLERPGMTEERFKDILSKQMPDAEKRIKADFIVQTDLGIDYAKKQVIELLNIIREI